jgi:hypothetical protein
MHQLRFAMKRLKEQMTERQLMDALRVRGNLRWIVMSPQTGAYHPASMHRVRTCIKKTVLGDRFSWGQVRGQGEMLSVDQLTYLKGIVAEAEHSGGMDSSSEEVGGWSCASQW